LAASLREGRLVRQHEFSVDTRQSARQCGRAGNSISGVGIETLVAATPLFAVALVALASSGCAHSDAEIRLFCLRQAHLTVKVPEIDSKNRETMVREYYLRCLEVHETPDAPADSAAPIGS
jgi:hypothetical protein